MTLEMKIREEKEISYDQGHAAGLEQGIIQTAMKMLENGFEVKDVSLCTGISETKIIQLRHKN